MSEQELAEIENIRSQLESKIKAKIRVLINETESRGLGQYRSYETNLSYGGHTLAIKIKDTNDMIYLRSNEKYYISKYSKTSAKDLLDCVKILKAVIADLQNKKQKETSDMIEAKKELESI